MKKILIPVFFVTLFFSSPYIKAQIWADTPYVIPHTIFVGDRGRLVAPLGTAFSEVAPFVLEGPAGLPQTPDLVIRRIELDRRGVHSRLLIDFVPFATGTLYLPPLAFLIPGEEDIMFPLFSVRVASILNPSNMVLSQPALPLAVPGTSLLVYGTGILILLLLSLGIVFSFLGPRFFRELLGRLRRRYRLYIMMRFLRRLKQEYSLDKNPNTGHYLMTLSSRMREFLSFYTGFNCQSLTAMEFLALPLDTTALDRWQLCNLFRAWDTLRFSGQGMEKADLFKAIDDVTALIAVLAKAEKEKPLRRSLAVPEVSMEGNL